MPTVEITNTDKGPRGVNTVDGLVMLDPGETRPLDVPTAELDDLPEYLSAGDRPAPEAPAGEQGDGLDDKTTKELDKIVADEGVTVPETGTGANGRVVKADIVAAIRAKRSAPPAGEQGDGLAGMTDDELRATVQALTGAEAPADAGRDALLALARGTAA